MNDVFATQYFVNLAFALARVRISVSAYRHCEEQSDEAISKEIATPTARNDKRTGNCLRSLRGAKRRSNLALVIANAVKQSHFYCTILQQIATPIA